MATARVKPVRRSVLGVVAMRELVYLFFRDTADKDCLSVEVSGDGKTFGKIEAQVIVRDSVGLRLPTKQWLGISLLRVEDGYAALVTKKEKTRVSMFWARGPELHLLTWQGEIARGLEGAVLAGVDEKGPVIVCPGAELAVQTGTGERKTLVGSQMDFFGPLELRPLHVGRQGEELLIFYSASRDVTGVHYHLLRQARVKGNDVGVIQVWETPDEWVQLGARPVGAVLLRGQYVSYWETDQGIWVVLHPWLHDEVAPSHLPALTLARQEGNPILAPLAENLWESKAAFNPAALTDEEGNVHLLYRAIGEEDLSVLGYARSRDGIHIDLRHQEPVFVPPDLRQALTMPAGMKSPYGSGGGGRGGCEDPRLTRIGDRVYLTYVAFNGWDSVRMAMTSIDWEDFKAGKWNWDEPRYMSPPGEIHKNWVLFPEKINGKFAVLHTIVPTVQVELIDGFDGFITSKSGNRTPPRGCKDLWLRGAGPPPMRTEDGWLLLCHVMDVRDPHRYKLGAMLLDHDQPTKVLCRSRGPILQPDEVYENAGHKAGVVYSCGAVIRQDELIVYYGGADTVTCVASTPIKDFMHKLKHHRHIDLQPNPITRA